MEGLNRAPRPKGGFAAYPLFFLATCILAVVEPPVWVGSRLGILETVVRMDSAQHAHDMLLGFAAAIVAGFLITKGKRSAILAAFAAWALARLAAFDLVPAPTVVGALASLAFVGLLFALAGVPFLRAARAGHNAVFAPILATLVAAECAYQIGALTATATLRDRAMFVALDAVAALMFTMGGRIIAGAAAGALRRAGVAVDHRKHLPLEWIGIVSIAVAAAGDAAGWGRAAAWPLAIAGAAGVGRLWRWKPWRLLGQRELVLLTIGYLWLSLGLLLPAGGWLSRVDALHALTIGALGTLGQVMMIRTVMQRRRLALPFPTAGSITVVAISAAALFRLLASILGNDGLMLAASIWSGSFLLLAVVLLRLLRR